MRKIGIIVSLFVLIANTAFAAALATHSPTSATTWPNGAVAIRGGVDATTAAAAPTPLVKTSTGVQAMVEFTDNTGYLLVTKHTTGSKVFGTCNSANNIYWRQVATGALATTMLTGITSGSAAASSFVGNGWTSY